MKKVLIITISIILVVGFVYFAVNFFQTQPVKAGSEHNVSGFAWSETIGWISFNSTNTGGPVSYGVNIDTSTGNLSGYAWSENIGWISFAPSGPYPEPPNYSAKLDIATNQITGWARACAGTVNGDCTGGSRTDGWDGWIKMAGTATDGSAYGVSRSGCDLIGFAWGSDVVGWIKFKGNSSYGVMTTFCVPPNAPSGLTATAASCSQINLSWQDNSDDEDGFKIERSLNAGFSSPIIIAIGPHAGTGATNFSDGGLSENTKYYYHVLAYNTNGNSDYSNEANTTTFDCPDVDLQVRPAGGGPFSDGPITIDYNTSAELSWTSSGATNCTASNNGGLATWTGAKALSGGPESTGNLIRDVIFTLTCTGSTGSDKDSVTVNVQFVPWWKEVFPW